MKSNSLLFSTVLFVASVCNGFSQAQQSQVVVMPDKSDGIYEVGDTVSWTVQWNGEGDAPTGRYTLLKGERVEAGQGEFQFENGKTEIEYTFDAPEHILLDVRWDAGAAPAQGRGRGRGGFRARAVGGAIASPEQIPVSSPKPADFEAFWDAKLQALAAVPVNPKFEADDSEVEGVDYWKIQMDNIRGSHIYGQLARPSEGEKLSALLIVQWAGVYPLQKTWATNRAADGWLVLNIEAHDMPIDANDRSRAPGNYPSLGNDDRDTSYFLRMYLSCYRAAQYLTERDDWNGETLVVMGDSQGGQQTLMTAGFHPAITAAIANVPAGFDMTGPYVGRKGGWPQWFDQVGDKDANAVRETSRYYDVANFVPNIKVPILVGIGLLDETCPPAGIYAGLNQVTAPKEIILLPTSGHQDSNGSQSAFKERRDNNWLPALRDGKPAPVVQSKLPSPAPAVNMRIIQGTN